MLKKEKMLLADFDRLTYLIYHLGFKRISYKSVDGICRRLQKEWACLEALQETGRCAGNIDSTESEIRLHKMWIQEFCENAPMETREWIRELEYQKNMISLSMKMNLANRDCGCG